MIWAVDPLLSYALSCQESLIRLIREFVECESPSGDTAALARFHDLVTARIGSMAEVRTLKGGHLRCEFDLPGRKKQGQTLVLGHSDTVWAAGTLAKMPFREAEGRLWGPGVLDMKAGLAFFLCAVHGLRELGLPVASRLVLLLNTDEEIGSGSSREFTEREAKRSKAVLVLEPATGL